MDVATPVEELRTLLKPYPAERMRAEAVSRRVNSVKNDDEACIASIAEEPLVTKTSVTLSSEPARRQRAG